MGSGGSGDSSSSDEGRNKLAAASKLPTVEMPLCGSGGRGRRPVPATWGSCLCSYHAGAFLILCCGEVSAAMHALGRGRCVLIDADGRRRASCPHHARAHIHTYASRCCWPSPPRRSPFPRPAARDGHEETDPLLSRRELLIPALLSLGSGVAILTQGIRDERAYDAEHRALFATIEVL